VKSLVAVYNAVLKVKDIMRTTVTTTDETKTAIEAAKTMAEKKIGCLIVMREDEVVGIITWQDIVTRVVARGLNPNMLKVGEFMTSPVIACPPESLISDVARTMSEKRIRRIPVVDGKKLVGILTAYDIALHGWGVPSH